MPSSESREVFPSVLDTGMGERAIDTVARHFDDLQELLSGPYNVARTGAASWWFVLGQLPPNAFP